LEERLTPTVAFHPYFGSESTSFGSGEKLNSPPIEMIFWGATYWHSPTAASAGAIASAVSTMMSSPVWQHLSQYSAGGTPYLANWGIDADHGDPGAVITDTDVRNELVNAIDDPSPAIFPPSHFGGVIPLYIVMTPVGTAIEASSVPSEVAGGDRTIVGYHFDFDATTSHGSFNLVYAWIGDYSVYGLGGTLNNLDTTTSAISHECSEAMTDAQPFSGITCSAGSSLPGGGLGEIGDFEPESYNLDEYRVNGVLVQATWDFNAGAFTVSDGNSLNLSLYASYTHNPDGSYTYNGSTLVISGDQLGSGYDDSVTVDADSGGGVHITFDGQLFAFEPGTQICHISIDAGTGTNTILVSNVTENCSVYITGNGLNHVTIGNSTNGVQGIQSQVYIYNGAPTPSTTGSSTLTIDDRADPVGRTVTMRDDDLGGGLHEGSLVGLAPAEIDWLDNTAGTSSGGVTSLSIYGGSGGNTFTVINNGSLWGGTYLSSGSGLFGNAVNVEGTTGPLTIDGGASNQYIYVGSHGGLFGGTLAQIRSWVFVENSDSSGTSNLWIDDSGDSTGQTTNLYFDELTSTGLLSFVAWNTYSTDSGGLTFLQVRGGSGFNTFDVHATGSGSFAYTTDVHTGTGGANVNVQSTTGTLDVYDDDGNDNVTVGSLSSSLGGGTLANIQGEIHVSGSSTCAVALYLDDSGDPSSHSEDLYEGKITGLSPAPIAWTANAPGGALGGVNLLRILGSAGSNVINVHSTSAFFYYTWLNGTGGGITTVNVLATTPNSANGYSALLVDGGAGIQYVYVGSNGAALGGTLDNIKGTVSVFNGPNGSSYLTVDDGGDTAAKVATLTNASLTGIAPAAIYYTGAEVVTLTVDGGSGGNTYKVQSTAAGTSTTINMGAGNDLAGVGGPGNNLDHIQGALTFNGLAGSNRVNVNDQGSTASHTYVLAGQTLSRTGAAAITSNDASMVVNGGSGGNAFAVSIMPTTSVMLNGGTGINTLAGPNVNNLWIINGPNAGTLDSRVSFKFMRGLTGGAANDSFKFAAAGNIAGTVSGGGGAIDRLDYSNNGGAAVTVDLQTQSAPQINSGAAGGFSSVNALVGSTAATDKLIGADANTTWVIAGVNAGRANSFAFAGIENLLGGSDLDVFKFTAAGSIAGSIDGGGAPLYQGNWLDYSGLSVPLTVNLTTGAAANVNGGAVGSIANIQNVRGGSGGNTLVGDAQGNILVGGLGADNIMGGSGASLLIGGKGADNVKGGSGGDILIGDMTTFDTNNAALMSILAEWQSPSSYAVHVRHLRLGGGLNGSHKLIFGTTVLDDGAADSVTAAPSAAALDWFFQGLGDTLINVESGEHINNS
jgi:hypothetical protein